MIFVFSYNRESMLINLLDELKNEKVTIIDDGSDFTLDHPGFIKLKHGGKKGFWKNWNIALDIYKQSKDEFALFLPDDVNNIQLSKIYEYHEIYRKEPYVFNIITDNRKTCWNKIAPTKINDQIEKIGFVDCNFFTNRIVFNRIGYYINPINRLRFRIKNISSGVGQQLTNRLTFANIPIYRSFSSLVYHGDHESKMHPEERKINPLISK